MGGWSRGVARDPAGSAEFCNMGCALGVSGRGLHVRNAPKCRHLCGGATARRWAVISAGEGIKDKRAAFAGVLPGFCGGSG